jgi:hypothetical protein
MGKVSKHYLPNGKEYKGPTHKMNGQVHTGASHSAKSKTLTHTAPKKKNKK